MENWILARNFSGEWVKVRQWKAGSKLFIGEDGTIFDIEHLDFTKPKIGKREESQKHFEEQNKKREEMYMKMLASIDVNAISDRKATIDEREYWRKLRGEIFMFVLKECNDNASMADVIERTKLYFDALYDQDFEFFKDKMMFNLPIK